MAEIINFINTSETSKKQNQKIRQKKMLISAKKEIIEFTCKGIHQEIERPEVHFRLIKNSLKVF